MESLPDQVWAIRTATTEDLPVLLSLMSVSVSCLCAASHTPSQMQAMIQSLEGRYNELINESRYFVIFPRGSPHRIIASGGWNVSKTFYSLSSNLCSDPKAKALFETVAHTVQIRGIYVHPEWTRRGLGTRLVKECEAAARRQTRVSKFELDATVNAVPLYESCGYVQAGQKLVELPAAEDLQLVVMYK